MVARYYRCGLVAKLIRQMVATHQMRRFEAGRGLHGADPKWFMEPVC